jgi:hypothetical protein
MWSALALAKGNILNSSLAELSRGFSIHNPIRIDLSNEAVAILFSPHYERYHCPEENDDFVARNDVIVFRMHIFRCKSNEISYCSKEHSADCCGLQDDAEIEQRRKSVVELLLGISNKELLDSLAKSDHCLFFKCAPRTLYVYFLEAV